MSKMKTRQARLKLPVHEAAPEIPSESNAAAEPAKSLKRAPYVQRTVQFVPIGLLKPAPWNPVSRTRDTTVLMRSIETFGLLDPIKVSPLYDIDDGHRRKWCCEQLGYEEVPVIVLSGEEADMYAELNFCSRKLTGHEKLEVYLNNPLAVPPSVRADMDRACDAVGMPMMKEMLKNGQSIWGIKTARRIARANDRDTSVHIRKALRWLLRYGCFGLVQRALNSGTPPAVIWKCIETNKPLSVTFGS